MAGTMDRLVARFWELMRLNYAPLGFSITETRRYEEWTDGDGMTAVRLEWSLRCPCGGIEYAQQALKLTDDFMSSVVEESFIPEELARGLANDALMLTAGREHLEEDVARGTLPKSVLDGAVYEGKLIT